MFLVHIGSCTFYLSIPWAKSLKDKRQCVKSIVEKMKNKFNISAAEIGENDNHNIALIGFACVSGSKVHAENMIDNVMNFVENHTEAEVYGIETELL
ncbi:MAG: DUF503 domain-containing protein [Defluviitaleaceae bacterium]|nr:DUF503 domain-containing protein [Defluviitaleaceae bacterium]